MHDVTDFYGIEQLLDEAGRDAVRRTREFLTKEIAPVISEYWTREEFPRDLARGFARLGIAGGLAATARRDGDEWVLDGQKKWIGNATFADCIVVWARDTADEQVKGFVVERETPGLSTTKIHGKIALRVVQNAHITLEGVRVPEANRLQRADSFRQTAEVLRVTRAGVAWQAIGCAMGAYEHALAYATERQQFGRPIAGFQLVQDLLVRMLVVGRAVTGVSAFV
jgi:alkylation response protein AidB-like acyl-CoA dehydrogenase